MQAQASITDLCFEDFLLYNTVFVLLLALALMSAERAREKVVLGMQCMQFEEFLPLI